MVQEGLGFSSRTNIMVLICYVFLLLAGQRFFQFFRLINVWVPGCNRDLTSFHRLLNMSVRWNISFDRRWHSIDQSDQIWNLESNDDGDRQRWGKSCRHIRDTSLTINCNWNARDAQRNPFADSVSLLCWRSARPQLSKVKLPRVSLVLFSSQIEIKPTPDTKTNERKNKRQHTTPRRTSYFRKEIRYRYHGTNLLHRRDSVI